MTSGIEREVPASLPLRVWHLEIDELMDEDDTILTDEEYEKKWRHKELIEDGYYDPFRIDQGDIAQLMKLNNVVSEEDADAHRFGEGDEMRLAYILEDNWDDLDEYSKVVYHVIRNTPSLPRWRRPYPPTRDHMQCLNEFLSIDPRSIKS
ncbi:MAG: hypothetical protein ACRD5J_12400 [Nitrososphaeraceae archaeon]